MLGAGQVIQGWDQGLKGQKLGGVLELKIPSELAYGEQAMGDAIPPNSPLIFTVEVLAVLPAGEAEPIYLDFKDIGIKTKKLGLTDELLATVQFSKTGLDLNDELNGREEADLLIGLKGKDSLHVGGGADVLIGGKGKDRFVYTDVGDSLVDEAGRDRILDFGKHKINLQALADDSSSKSQVHRNGGEVRFAKETLLTSMAIKRRISPLRCLGHEAEVQFAPLTSALSHAPAAATVRTAAVRPQPPHGGFDGAA